MSKALWHRPGRAARWARRCGLALLLWGLWAPLGAWASDEPALALAEGESRLHVLPSSAEGRAVLGPLSHPQGPGAWQWRLGLGLELEVLPLVLMESEWRYFPRLTAGVEWGLPYGFGLEANASLLVVDNRLSLGPSWAIRTGPVTWGLRYLLGFHLGWVGVAAFDTLSWALSNEPGFLVGVELDDSFVSLNVDVRLLALRQWVLADWSVWRSGFYWSSLDSGLTVETPVGDGLVSYGVELSYAEADELLWFAFSDSPNKLLATRFQVSYVF